MLEKEGMQMEEFDKIKAFSESVAERQANLAETASAPETDQNKTEEPVMDFPKYLSQFRPQVTEDKSENKPLIWALGGLALVLLAGVGGFCYFYGAQEGTTEIVEIRPTLTPVKIRPENPGGLKIAGTDKVVYDRTSAHKAEVMEKLFPEPEQPIAPPADQVLPVEEMIPPVPQEVEVVPEPEAPVIEEAPVAVPEATVEEVVVPLVEPAEEIQAQPVEVVPEPVSEVKPVPVVSAKEIWRAQLLSSSSKSKVEKAWKSILNKHKALLSDMPYQIVPVEIAGKGTFYRLQVGSFVTAEQVRELCTKLKQRKQECIPTKQDNK